MRPSEESILMGSAWLWSKRSTCSRLHVGAVLSRGGRVISSGYNGNVGPEHCNHIDESPDTTAAHAEENCVAFAARYGVSTLGSTLYCTHQPCYRCSRILVNAGVSEVVFQLDYRDSSGIDLLKQANINVRKYSDIS